MKWRRSCNQFPSFMSEPSLSTKSMPLMNLEKLKVFSSVRRRETNFKHAQGYQWAGAFTGSFNFFQSTIITVYEVEHQKTVNTILAEQTIWVSEVVKEFCHYFLEKMLVDTKRPKAELDCIPKASQSILQNPMAQKQKNFWRTDQNTPQSKHRKNSKSSKKIPIEQFFQISVHKDIRSTKEATFEHKTLKSIHSWPNH